MIEGIELDFIYTFVKQILVGTSYFLTVNLQAYRYDASEICFTSINILSNHSSHRYCIGTSRWWIYKLNIDETTTTTTEAVTITSTSTTTTTTIEAVTITSTSTTTTTEMTATITTTISTSTSENTPTTTSPSSKFCILSHF